MRAGSYDGPSGLLALAPMPDRVDLLLTSCVCVHVRACLGVGIIPHRVIHYIKHSHRVSLYAAGGYACVLIPHRVSHYIKHSHRVFAAVTYCLSLVLLSFTPHFTSRLSLLGDLSRRLYSVSNSLHLPLISTRQLCTYSTSLVTQ